jgi:hypothetical protein
MTEYNKDRIKKFAVSMFWNVGVYLIVAMIEVISSRLGYFNLSPQEVALISILCARITKMLNSAITARQELKALE